MSISHKRGNLSSNAIFLLAFFVILALVMFSLAGIIRQQKKLSDRNKKQELFIDSLERKIDSLSHKQVFLNLDPLYFVFDSSFCHYRLKNSSQLFLMDNQTIWPQLEPSVIEAGKSLNASINALCSSFPEVAHYLIIEGRSSTSAAGYMLAESLYRYWYSNGITFDLANCRCFISGEVELNQLKGNGNNHGDYVSIFVL
ncbi:MAG: hypothetical protein IJJ72_06565 [Bacteroidales bacterium]|nr:hypothetical protein [Bacteroidales bacterium]